MSSEKARKETTVIQQGPLILPEMLDGTTLPWPSLGWLVVGFSSQEENCMLVKEKDFFTDLCFLL